MIAFHVPPKWGACGGLNFQMIFCVPNSLLRVSTYFFDFNILYTSSGWDEPMKFVPQAEWIFLQGPRMDRKRFKQLRNIVVL